MRTDTLIQIACMLPVNAVLFGLGAIPILSVPALRSFEIYLIPCVVLLSFALSPFVARAVARRMRIRYWGQEAWKKGDILS